MHDYPDFMEHIMDEEACRQYLFQQRWPNGFMCPQCGCGDYFYIQTRDKYECTECKAQASVTSGTMLHRTKLPASYWLFVFYWFIKGQNCSARKLSALLNIHYRTALRMLNIARQAMRDWNGETPIMEMVYSEDPYVDMLQQCNAIEIDHHVHSATEASNSVEEDDRTIVTSMASMASMASVTSGGSGMDKEAVIAVSAAGQLRAVSLMGTPTGDTVNSANADQTSYSIQAKRAAATASPAKAALRSFIWRPRLTGAYRTEVYCEAVRVTHARAKHAVTAVYRNVRNWQRYLDEYHFRQIVGMQKRGKEEEVLSFVLHPGVFAY